MSTRLLVAEVCILALCASSGTRAEHLGEVPLHHVIEIELEGPELSATDVPARRRGFTVEFQHESERSTEPVTGFWDGDGKGGAKGGVFKVRFSPGKVGCWRIVGAHGPVAEFDEQRKGDTFDCVPSNHPGRWIAEGRWYRRSDGSRPYIVGNTHYTFLSRQNRDGRARSDPVADVRENARFYKKLRFSLVGGRYPDNGLKPFLDDGGDETDDGQYSFRPNPRWFHERVDPVIAEAFRQDLICDLILCGPDTREARSTLAGNPGPWLRYVAARYSAYPNVWFCLANEWNIKKPRYSAKAIRDAGDILRVRTLSRNPVSVHGNSGDWESDLAGRWHDHAIIQFKTRRLDDARDAIVRNWTRVRRPIFNDENGYQGDGDGFSAGDVVEGCFGTFLGGGYPTTGEKYGGKLGQYFWGGFDAGVHSASARLLLLRDFIDHEVRFWDLAPVEPSAIAGHPFAELPGGGPVLENPGEEYVIGRNTALHAVPIALPPGVWRVRQVDLMTRTVQTLAAEARGQTMFSCPDSRASLTHFRRLADTAKRTCSIEEIFTPQSLHNHGSSIVECPNGDLLVSWYNGSGERSADDVKILGARLRRDATRWSKPFLMADTPGFPDCNSALFLDPAGKLWLFWPLIVANRWETALLQSRTASEFERDGAPRWEAEKTILLKPGQRFVETVERAIVETGLEGAPRLAKEISEKWFAKIREMAKDKYTRRMGWMPRVKPLAAEGRIILPLYSDGFDFSMMALSDDGGTTWRASAPLVGGGNVQPSLARRSDGTIVAYMRDNGLPPQRLLYSESKDRGETWSRVVDTVIPNSGSGVEVLRLRDGRWVLIHNDTERGRGRLAVWMSEDEGKTWPWKRALEPRGDVDGELSASYPAIIEGQDGTIHVSYTHSAPGRGSTIRHAALTPWWVMGK